MTVKPDFTYVWRLTVFGSASWKFLNCFRPPSRTFRYTKKYFEDNELSLEATVKESLTVQTEGARQVQRKLSYYNLDLILAIGYRVRSSRGVQFRKWVSTHLKEFLRKGFVIDDERMKNPVGWVLR